MSAFPYMQLYPSDYLGDTRHLSTEQHGAYLLLLMAMWNAEGALPDDDGKLARITGLSRSRWLKHRPDIIKFFSVTEGVLRHKRIDADIEAARELSEKRAAAGRASAAARSNKNESEKPLGNEQLSERDFEANALENNDTGGTHVPQANANTSTIEERGAATAAPAGADARPSPTKARFDEVEATCRDALGRLAPIDLVIGPIVQLAEERDLRTAVLPAMIDAARSSRSPIRTWSLLAVKARERLDAPPIQSIPTVNGAQHGPHRKPSASDFARADIERLEREQRERERGTAPVLRIASG